MKKWISLLLALVMTAVLCCACSTAGSTKTAAPAAEAVTLTLCAPWEECKALETVSTAFHEKYPECTIKYEYLQNYDTSIETRLSSAPDSLDLFLSNNINSTSSSLYPYALELYSQEGLDLSGTNPSLMTNAELVQTDPDAPKQIYCISLGGEMRMLYVNKTLLGTLGLEVPTTAEELLAACQVLKDAGYIPMMGNPGQFAQWLMYPYVCSLIANAADYQAVYEQVNTCAPGVSELFREPITLLYDMTKNGYYNYKYVETEMKLFTDTSHEGIARSFFNIAEDGESYKKVDDVGVVAFTGGLLSQRSFMEKTKEDYHSAIEYESILAPVSSEGGYAYVSPGRGIAVNKNSTHVDWAVKYLNFLFGKEVNTAFAKEFNYIPNIADSFAVVKEMYNIPESHICDVGQATFDYDFYTTISNVMISVVKGNNPKYMDVDAAGQNVMYPLEYYMTMLEDAFAAQREGRKAE